MPDWLLAAQQVHRAEKNGCGTSPEAQCLSNPNAHLAGHGAKLSVPCRNGLGWAASSVLQFQEGILTPKSRSFGDWESWGREGIKSHLVPSNSKEKAIAWDLRNLQLNVCANSCSASPSYFWY